MDLFSIASLAPTPPKLARPFTTRMLSEKINALEKTIREKDEAIEALCAQDRAAVSGWNTFDVPVPEDLLRGDSRGHFLLARIRTGAGDWDAFTPDSFKSRTQDELRARYRFWRWLPHPDAG